MAYGGGDSGGRASRELLAEIPNLIVLILLILVLLFVVTKFKWVHCSQIPQWCPIYCSIVGKSQVAVIHGASNDDGIGNAKLLRDDLLAYRQFTYAADFQSNQISQGLLDDYELVVLTNMKNISLRQAVALRDYIKRGGSVIIEGDSATRYVFTQEDESFALAENLSRPFFYEDFKAALNTSQGFGLLGDALGVKYLKTLPAAGGMRFYAVKISHLALSGVKNFDLPVVPLAQVTENPTILTKVAEIQTADGKTYPAMLERKTAGRMMFIAVPLELIDSRTLLSNVFDYLVAC